MKKIPMLLKFNYENNGPQVLKEYNEKAIELLRKSPIKATLKYDGTAMMCKDGRWFHRRTVKGDKYPDSFYMIEKDPITQKSFGWVPMDSSSDIYKFFKEALNNSEISKVKGEKTFELIGPKINGNRHKLDKHKLVPHGETIIDILNLEILKKHDVNDFISGMLYIFKKLKKDGIEGVVFWDVITNKPIVKLRVSDLEKAKYL